MRRLIAIASCVVLFVACAEASVTVIPPEALPEDVYPQGKGAPTVREREVTLYMLDGNRLTPVVRKGPSKLLDADLAMMSLLCGPTAEEQKSGFTTAIEGVELNGVQVNDEKVAEVDLTDDSYDADSEEILVRRFAQIVFTLTNLEAVEAVAFFRDGRSETVLDGERNPVTERVSQGRYTRLAPTTTLAPAEFESDLPIDARGDCRSAVAGPASTP